MEGCVASRYVRPRPYSPASSQTALVDRPLLLAPCRQKSNRKHNPLKSEWPEQSRSRCPLSFARSCSRSEIKAITQNHLGNQVVGRTRKTNAQAEIDFPLWCDIQINRGENLVLLLRDRIESRHWAGRTVIFQTSRDLRSQIVAEFEIWRKDDALVPAFAVEGSVQRGV